MAEGIVDEILLLFWGREREEDFGDPGVERSIILFANSMLARSANLFKTLKSTVLTYLFKDPKDAQFFTSHFEKERAVGLLLHHQELKLYIKSKSHFQ